MDEPEDLARRFMALWSDYLTALSAEPSTAELMQRWLALGVAGRQPPADEGEVKPAGPPAGAATAAGASRERDDVMAEFARRVDELETRLAAVERGRRPASRVRPRTRPAGNRQG